VVECLTNNGKQLKSVINMKKLYGLGSILLTSGLVAFATPVTPTGTYESLSGADWGGSGNPDNAMVSTVTSGADTITLALQAQQRYSNPALYNNHAGIYYAGIGANNGLTSPGHSVGATWNFDYYISVNNSDFNNYTFELLYGTDSSSLVTMAYGPALIAEVDGGPSFTTSAGTTIAQDSENLSFSFLGTPINFNPNAGGIYSFELEAFNSDGTLVDTSAINVDVPDAASTASLLGLAFLALAVFSFKQDRWQVRRQLA
jgi:hypothetical protein